MERSAIFEHKHMNTYTDALTRYFASQAKQFFLSNARPKTVGFVFASQAGEEAEL
jgi:hypothetical protein